MKDIYSIGELCKELNINKETIRYYEKIGLLSEPKKNSSGYRIYSKEDLDKIRFILIIKNFGFSLKEINILLSHRILCGDIENVKSVVKNKLSDVNNQMAELAKTKKLLEKVNTILSSHNTISCKYVEAYLQNLE